MNDLRDQLQTAAARPENAPIGMPGAFYTDATQFEHECKTVLRRGWHCLGRIDEVATAGDFFTVQVLNEPLIVVRGDDDVVRVLANVCRHRGMPLVTGRGTIKRFVCSYHAWAYGRDGALLRAARMENAGFDAKDCRLHEFAMRAWNGFIYCNLEGEQHAFDQGFAALNAQLAPYETQNFRLVHVGEETWSCNWKALVENFMEGYHLSVVHPQTLHGYTPTGLAKKTASGDGFTSYAANYPDNIPPRGAGASGLSTQERQRSLLFAVFPTQVASQAASLLVSLMIFPVSVDEIRVKWTMSVYGDDLDTQTINQRIALWEDVNREDREKLEWMHGALRSAHAQSGPLAGEDYEGTIRDFHRWLAAMDRQA
jgi:phenylpropionate dioxygenase-like ring-hydroxylating dioxygenase large terminal subunit